MTTTRKFYLRTPYGQSYYIHADGAIERADGQNGTGSHSWTLRGLTSTNNFAFGTMAVPFANLEMWLKSNPSLRYKNGSPRFSVLDLDHGTARAWGNTKHHGIAELRMIA